MDKKLVQGEKPSYIQNALYSLQETFHIARENIKQLCETWRFRIAVFGFVNFDKKAAGKLPM